MTKSKIGIIFCANKKHILAEHPERPERVLVSKKILSKKYPELIYKQMELYDGEVIEFLEESGHNIEHIKLIKRKFKDKNSSYSIGIESYKGCLEESKCLITMCNLIKENKIDYAINIIRPPGHHCSVKHPAGFCLINTAIASAYNLLKKYKKVNIFDIDLHHGGGTQKMMEMNKNISYISIHNRNVWSDGLYRKGINGNIDNRIINLGLPGGSTDKEYIYASKKLIKSMRNFSKEVVILSVGIDAHKNERGYVGNNMRELMNLTSNYYGELGNMLKMNFEKVFVILEGGYNENAISESFERMIEGLNGKDNFKLDKNEPRQKVIKIIDKLFKKID